MLKFLSVAFVDIPSGIVRCDYILSNKDVEVPMTLMSKRNEGDIPDSRIVEELNGGSWPVNIDHGSPSYEYESYGVTKLIKMISAPKNGRCITRCFEL